MLHQEDSKHVDGLRVLWYRQSDALSGRGIEVIQEALFIDFASHNGASLLVKSGAVVSGNGCGTRKSLQQPGKPLGQEVGEIALCFGKLQGQIMVQDALLHLDLPQEM